MRLIKNSSAFIAFTNVPGVILFIVAICES